MYVYVLIFEYIHTKLFSVTAWRNLMFLFNAQAFGRICTAYVITHVLFCCLTEMTTREGSGSWKINKHLILQIFTHVNQKSGNSISVFAFIQWRARFLWKKGNARLSHVIEVFLLSQSASEKNNQEKKPTNLCASPKMCLPCLIIKWSW